MLKKFLIFIFWATAATGCQNTTSAKISQEDQIDPGISAKELKDYLAVNVGTASFGGKMFCAYRILAAEQKDNMTTLYLWVLCQEFYQEQQQLQRGAGVSLPVSVNVENVGDRGQILEHTIPRDGSYYGEDVKVIFPPSVWPKISPQSRQQIEEYNNSITVLEVSTEEEAILFFVSGE